MVTQAEVDKQLSETIDFVMNRLFKEIEASGGDFSPVVNMFTRLAEGRRSMTLGANKPTLSTRRPSSDADLSLAHKIDSLPPTK